MLRPIEDDEDDRWLEPQITHLDLDLPSPTAQEFAAPVALRTTVAAARRATSALARDASC